MEASVLAHCDRHSKEGTLDRDRSWSWRLSRDSVVAVEVGEAVVGIMLGEIRKGQEASDSHLRVGKGVEQGYGDVALGTSIAPCVGLIAWVVVVGNCHADRKG